MGIVIDIILVLIVALSAFLGYKKGLIRSKVICRNNCNCDNINNL